MTNVESMKYLQHWSNSLLKCIQKLNHCLEVWTKNMPTNMQIQVSNSLSNDTFMKLSENGDNQFTLETIVASVLNAQGDMAKLSYTESTVPYNKEAALLIHEYEAYLSHIESELGKTYLHFGSFKEQLEHAKLLATVGKNLSTLPK